MKDLIKALNIILKYEDEDYPFHCEHDVLFVKANHELFSEQDINEL